MGTYESGCGTFIGLLFFYPQAFVIGGLISSQLVLIINLENNSL